MISYPISWYSVEEFLHVRDYLGTAAWPLFRQELRRPVACGF